MSKAGRIIPFPSSRRLVLDICWAARFVPAFPVEQTFQLKDLSEARNATNPKISWVSLFLKAYGLAGRDIPELRQVFARYPWVRLYEHPHSVISVSVHRDDGHGGTRLIWARLIDCESKPLTEIQNTMVHTQAGPIAEVFRDGYRFEKIPAFIRRTSMWLGMHCQPRQKAKKMGTGSISTLAGENTLNRFHPLIVTTSLAYSRCEADGSCLVTLLCDHRVLDGVLAARALKRIEFHLNTTVYNELR